MTIHRLPPRATAGAVVTRDVPDFAIVAGSPARVVRQRFPEGLQARLLASRWWDKPIDQLALHMDFFVQPFGEETLHHPLLQSMNRP